MRPRTRPLEIDQLPAVVDPVVAALDEANVVNRTPFVSGNVETAFAQAALVIRERLRMHRHTGVPMETRGLVAEHDPRTGILTLWGAAKVKHFNRAVLAQLLELDPGSVRLVEVHVGGGFGVRGELYPEDFLVPFLALRLGRPVKWVEDRAEHFVAANHAREQEHELEVAASADGRLLAFRDRAWCDQGAYVRTQGIVPQLLPALHLPGPYTWEAFSIESLGVLTNRTPVGAYRGPGMTEATFVRERMVDRVAGELGIDPADLRRRNLIPADAMPFRFELAGGTPPFVYESGDFPAFFERLLRESGYDRLRAEQAGRRARGEHVGIGLAAYVEVGGVGPYEEARITTTAEGILVHVGVGSLGQGVETVLAQIAAEELDVPVELITIDHHDTEGVPMGFGSYASRSTVLAGNAVALAARDFRARAAEALGVDESELVLGADAITGIEGIGRFEKELPSYSFGASLSLVSVETETGRIRAERHTVAHDVGRAVNPGLLRGQLAGAAAQGIGGALYEELAYDENGQPLSTTFADYLMPTAAELPPVDVVIIEHPTLGNPLGVKGGGEAGMAGAPAAVANAVADALGVGVTSLPLRAERVRALLRTHGNGAPERPAAGS
jgi:carbon-monoxide dehydrogenase large subunit